MSSMAQLGFAKAAIDNWGGAPSIYEGWGGAIVNLWGCAEVGDDDDDDDNDDDDDDDDD